MTWSSEDELLRAYAEADLGPTPGAMRRGRARILAHAQRRAARARRVRVALAGGGLLAAAAAVVLTLAPSPPPSPGPTPAATADALMLDPQHAQTLMLAHGGTATITAGARVRVVRNDARGAELELVEGRVALDVPPHAIATWLVRVGGYRVEASGARLEVLGAGGRPEVTVLEGVARTFGPDLPTQGLENRPGDRTTEGPSIAASHAPTPTHPAAAADDPTPTRPAAADDPMPTRPATADNPTQPRPATADESTARSRGPSPPSWITAFRAALTVGDSSGIARSLPRRFPRGAEGLSAAELLEAGDALRVTGSPLRAERSYRAACRAAPRSSACGAALVWRAILRAEAGDRASAITIISTYLRRYPQGPLAREAWGRRLEWRQARGDTAGARADAAEYLRRWPRGPRAELARTIASPRSRRP